MTTLDLHFLHDDPLADWLDGAVRADIDSATLSKVFRAFYRVRPILPIFVRQMLQRLRSGNQTLPDDWFLPHALVNQLESLDAVMPSVWPDNADFAFVLTHDVETCLLYTSPSPRD